MSIINVSWDSSKATIVEDLAAVREKMLSQAGYPLANVIASETTIRLLDGRPRIADLSRDPVACAMLRRLKNRPWDAAAMLVLADRVEETIDERHANLVRGIVYEMADPTWGFQHCRQLCRRAKRRKINEWKTILARWFGPF